MEIKTFYQPILIWSCHYYNLKTSKKKTFKGCSFYQLPIRGIFFVKIGICIKSSSKWGFTLGILMPSGVCVCVCLYSFTVKASSICKISETYLRGTDQRSSVVNINLGASAKFPYLRIWKCHISPPKTKNLITISEISHQKETFQSVLCLWQELKFNQLLGT